MPREIRFIAEAPARFSTSASSTYTHRGYGNVRQGGGMIATIHLNEHRRRRCPRRRATPASWRLESAARVAHMRCSIPMAAIRRSRRLS